MIVVDTSALMTMLLRQDGHRRIRDALRAAPVALMSAGTFTECMIVAGRRGVDRLVVRFVRLRPIQIVPLDFEGARFAGDVYSVWGKGIHPARLNFGDCFAYALAISRGLPLLYVGGDFAQTDVRSAL